MQRCEKARKMDYQNFFLSLKFRFLELCSSYHNRVSYREEVVRGKAPCMGQLQRIWFWQVRGGDLG